MLLYPGAIILNHTFVKHNLSLWRSMNFPKITMHVLWWILSSRGQCSTNSEDTVYLKKKKKTKTLNTKKPRHQMLTNFILFQQWGKHSKIFRICYNAESPGCKTESIANYPSITQLFWPCIIQFNFINGDGFKK